MPAPTRTVEMPVTPAQSEEYSTKFGLVAMSPRVIPSLVPAPGGMVKISCWNCNVRQIKLPGGQLVVFGVRAHLPLLRGASDLKASAAIAFWDQRACSPRQRALDGGHLQASPLELMSHAVFLFCSPSKAGCRTWRKWCPIPHISCPAHGSQDRLCTRIHCRTHYPIVVHRSLAFRSSHSLPQHRYVKY
jgi:hypothetical protein